MPLSAHFLSTEEDRGQIGAAQHAHGGGEQRNEDGRVRDRRAPLAGRVGARSGTCRQLMWGRVGEAFRHRGGRWVRGQTDVSSDLRLYCCSKAAGRKILNTGD